MQDDDPNRMKQSMQLEVNEALVKETKGRRKGLKKRNKKKKRRKGPFISTQFSPFGAVEIVSPEKYTSQVNSQRLNLYQGAALKRLEGEQFKLLYHPP